MNKLTDQQIIKSWKNNVKPWVEAIDQAQIQSRVEVTNQAIVDVVTQFAPKSSPKTVMDVGCGEGWLTRALAHKGMDVLGVDVVPQLLEAARCKGAGRFKTIAYEDFSAAVPGEKFDVIVCNFSLLGDESVEHFFKQAHNMINDGGALIVQTIHPVVACADEPYQDGWRAGSWTGFSEQFTDPAPWYFRTMDSWKALFTANGLILEKVIEPINPKTKLPASVIFIGRI
ncbi:MAG: class I SAM-dependent methyltransferase [Algicola sp.]|nr:class I SAM-dependent methyltransferase [Algicola sp.]